ncbi:DUF3892 domain-containing protein [Limosilactobacillus reuteri]|uniref:DUF3892 domain-containing protein n=1 Tax=Limosilactobacillus reuteri TaxID=1598 RepID=A0A317GF90_LIMRT|nr:DUF3892 domain-containing protein [Limosilactobacillus reuteri]MCH5385246.1 DUF3892 domain-containing protein [Limosilactobacillus reuteri]PWT43899.1 DUF3892 domain-containing protein [Limosilactobacillus reuteri]PWT50581.1 DUF3892 domain-containing protein [Limosilactobacillus reuteri]PWT61695.1 DUF3892 domain-containing protein [Limosilactobacillus reuteri]
MANQIVAVRIKDIFALKPSDITDVKLLDGSIESVQSVVKYIDSGSVYFYTTSWNSRAEVETVHPDFRDPYIRTKANYTTADNLLSLPKF